MFKETICAFVVAIAISIALCLVTWGFVLVGEHVAQIAEAKLSDVATSTASLVIVEARNDTHSDWRPGTFDLRDSHEVEFRVRVRNMTDEDMSYCQIVLAWPDGLKVMSFSDIEVIKAEETTPRVAVLAPDVASWPEGVNHCWIEYRLVAGEEMVFYVRCLVEDEKPDEFSMQNISLGTRFLSGGVQFNHVEARLINMDSGQESNGMIFLRVARNDNFAFAVEFFYAALSIITVCVVICVGYVVLDILRDKIIRLRLKR